MEFASLGTRTLARSYWLLPAVAVAACAPLVGGWQGGVILYVSQALFAWGVGRAAFTESHLDLGGLLGQVILLTISGIALAVLIGIPAFLALNSPGAVAWAALAICTVLCFLVGIRLWPVPVLLFADPDNGPDSNPFQRCTSAVARAITLNRGRIERIMEGAPTFAALGALTLIPFALEPFGAGAAQSTAWWIVTVLECIFLPIVFTLMLSEVVNMAREGTTLQTRTRPAPVSLFGAASEGDLGAMKQLVGKGDINEVREGRTALHFAITGPDDQRHTAVYILLDAGADTNIADSGGLTPAHLAARANDPETLRMLIDNGADLNATTRDGNKPIDEAARTGAWQAMHMLREVMSDVSLDNLLMLAAASSRDDASGVEYLLKRGASPKTRGRLGRTALHAAAMQGNSAICKALLEEGADINGQDDFGNSAVMEAARAGANGVLRCLKQYQPDANLADKPGRTALLVAVTSKRADVETVSLLLEMGADPKARNRDGRTAGEIAAEAENWDLAEALGVSKDNRRDGIYRDERTTVIDLALFETREDRDWAEAQLKKRSRTELASATQTMPVVEVEEKPAEDTLPLNEPEDDTAVYQSLIEAAQSDDIQQLESIIEVQRNVPEWWLVSAFLNAVASGHEIAPGWLLENGLDCNAQSEAGVSLLESTAQQAPPNVGVLTALLDAGASVQDHPQVMLWLCGMADQQHGRKPGQVDELVEQQLADLIRRITEDKSTVQIADARKRTPLHWAARYRSVACIQALIDAGADVAACDDADNTPLMFAAYSGRPNVALVLIKAGADAKAANKKGVSPLSYAMDRQDLTLSKILMGGKRGETVAVDATAGEDEKRQSLLTAAGEGNVGRIKRLIAGSVDLEATDSEGCTALIRAAGRGHAEVVSALLHAGANAYASSTNGTTALGAAVLGDHSGVVKTLIDKDVKADQQQRHGVTPLMLAAARWSPQLVQLLLRSGANVNAQDESESTPLCAAVQNALGKADVDPGMTTVENLLNAGANVNHANDEGQTPLMLLLGVRSKQDVRVSEQGLSRLAELLIQSGATVDQQDLSGWSALHAAAAHGFTEVAKLLMDSGCSRRLRDMNGLSPVDLAMNSANEAMVDLFIARG